MPSPSSTLVRPPPIDPSRSAIENVLELTPLTAVAPDIFTNTRPLWHPPGARGIYGGAVIAQCLSAAQSTIPPPSPSNNHALFFIHSMHCYFVLAGDASIPILYHVERVRDGKSFMTRTVQARQRGKCIFTTTLSFVREGSGGVRTVDHGWGMPAGAMEGLLGAEKLGNRKGDEDKEDWKDEEEERKEENGEEARGPFVSRRLGIENNSSLAIQTKRTRQWIKARGKISSTAGIQAHLSALAYMSDSYFIGTVSRVHNLWRFGGPKTSQQSPTSSSSTAINLPKPHPMAAVEAADNASTTEHRPSVGMMVSLDHTIYFHRPRECRADEWMFAEMESPWAGDGRGLVTQRIWNREGKLLATCVQEGLVRLKQDDADNQGAERQSKL